MAAGTVLTISKTGTRKLELRYFSLFRRLDRLILVNFNYERSSRLRRKIVSGINRLDRMLLSLPIIQPLAGGCVIFGHPIK